MEEPRSKRQRVNDCRGVDDYLPGNIVEIELRNFMTYDHLKCEPAPRLNLVIGPNGSGKSSIVCAIALGLGGDPQILGRAASIGAFVKRGEESGYVKISLRGDTARDKIVITRKIDAQNKSEWLLNGVSVPKRDVIEVIHKFNIQVNNLTQFLPQDRVCEFAKLSPIQLLEETEKAVGDPELPIQHQKLIEQSRDLKKLEMTVKQNQESLNQLKALNADLERDVERVRQRQQLLEKVELMKKKLPWLRFDMKQSEYLEAKRQQNEAKKRLNESAKILNDLSAPLEQKRHLKSGHDAANKKLNNRIHQNSKKIMELFEFHGDLVAQVKAKHAEIEELRKLDNSRQHNFTKAVEELKAAEKELADLPHYEPPKDALEKLNREIMKLELEANQRKLLRSEKESISYQKKGLLRQVLNRLKEFENKNMKLLEALRNSGADKIIDAYHWLQSHRSEFNKEVYGPVLLEVNVNDQTHAAYLENHVPYYIWKAVVCQDPRDRDHLVRNLKSFDIPVLNYVNRGPSKKLSLEIPNQLRELGIYSRLDQVFDAPDAVHEILTSQTSISSSYIGTHETDRKADELSKHGILDFWTPESHYRWTISRYGGHTSASVEPLRRSRLFLYSTDSQDFERLKSKQKEHEDEIADLDESIQTLQREQRQFEDNAAILQKEHEEIMNRVRLEKKRHRELESRVDLKRRRVESLQAEVDVESNCRKLLDKVSQLNGRRFEVVMQLKDLLVNAVSQKWVYAGNHMSSIEIDMQITALEVDLKQHEKAALLATTHFENCKEATETCKRQLAAAKREAEAVAIITEELKREFAEMPTTIEELDAAIQDTISQANSILFVNQNILQDYEARQNKIDSIAMKLESDVEELQKCSSDINNLKDKWLPTLRDLVSKINETFSRNFREMAIAGEVSLDERDMDFDQYGVLIKVKFRETGQLQVLSAHHQSGGERSVSTILYLVSLQDLTNCPFRVVDEINQGMDLVNERKMFQQLVRAASQRSTPQCFLLTPKLLDNLDYSEACSILNIMNGPWIKKASEVWKSGQSWRAITGLETQG